MTGYVYLICDSITDTYKIGRTKNNVQKRLKQLQTGCSSELFVVNEYKTEYPVQLESFLHRKFINKRLLNEWFKLDSFDVKNFNNVCEHYEKIIKSLNEEELVV